MKISYHSNASPRHLLLLGLFFSLFLFSTSVQAQDTDEGTDDKKLIEVNSSLNYELLEQNQYTRKPDILLNAVSKNRIKPGKLYLGASLIALLDYQASNTDSKFGYLMRHPTSSNQIGKEVSEATLHSAQIMIAGSITNWLSIYSELLYDPQQSFGSGTITTLTRNQTQIRRGFIVFGNLDKFPVYGALGKLDVNFGYQGSVSPFTNSTMWHAFAGLGFGGMVGVNLGGFNGSFTAIQGGAQFRALHVPVEGTTVPSRLNNFAFDGNYTLNLGQGTSVQAGASFVRGTSYCQGFPVVHFMPCDQPNGAGTFYGSAYVGKLRLIGAWAITEDTWPGTHNPVPPLNQFAEEKVSSLVGGASYVLSDNGMYSFILSGEFSNFVAGPDGSPWERQNQYVLGGSLMINKSSKLFIEVFRTEGYAPLNFISGGNLENPGATHSDRDARSHGIIFGGHIVL
ncbi:MAG: hypothetical protein AB8G77_15760 [Rhodothermales bacterium]